MTILTIKLTDRHRLLVVMAVFLATTSAILMARSVPIRADPPVYAPRLSQGSYGILLADCAGNELLEDYTVTLAELHQPYFTDPDPCDALYQEGMAILDQARYPDALEKFQEALDCYRGVGDRAGEGASLNAIGYVHSMVGQYEVALDYYQQSLAIRREIGDRAGEGLSLNNIGFIYHSLGQYEVALDYYQQALAIRQEIGDRVGEGDSLGNVGGIYYSLGQYQEALGYYQQALAIRQGIGDRAGEGQSLNNIGFIYSSLGQYEAALDHYRQALAIRQEIGDRAGEGTSLNNIGFIYSSLGQYEEALDYYQQSLAIRQEIGDRAGEGVSLGSIGFIYRSLGQYEAALGYYQQALLIQQEIGDRARERVSLDNIGGIYESLGQYEVALDYYQQAVAVVEMLRGKMTVEETKSSFTAEQVYMCDHAVSLLIQMGRPQTAFDYVQRAKARTFLDQLGNVRVNALAAGNSLLIEEEQTLRGEIRTLTDSLRDESSKSPNERSEGVLQSLRMQLERKREAYARLLTRLKLENPEYASLVAVETLTLTQTQQLLTDTVLIEYYVLPTQTLVFVVTPDSFHLESISVTQEILYDEIKRFELETQSSLQGVPASLQKLYGWLIAPIEPYLNAPRLIIAPHGFLHYVPFAALHDGNRYLIERYVLSQLPSASILPFILEKRKATINPPLIVGDPDGSLPFSRQEAQAVAKRYGTTAYVGQEAQEQLVWAQGADAGILHLSTHGVYDAVSPLFSHLLLAPDAEEKYDGLLEVHEVYNLDLHNADLVVLSACQTNLGERSAGDEVIGLNRAFIYAGTPSVLATLWSVEDKATKKLMLAFYDYLDQGYTKGEALRQAQVDLLRNPDTAHPHFWAGFVLTGDMGQGDLHGDWGNFRASKGARGWLWIVGVVILLAAIGSGAWMWKRRRKCG